jgi:excisionase family DNA binding protein
MDMTTTKDRSAARSDRRRLATVQESATYLRVSVKTVRRMIAGGELIAYRLGSRAIRIDMEQLESLLRPIPAAGRDREW